jgi:hypothetical protein
MRVRRMRAPTLLLVVTVLIWISSFEASPPERFFAEAKNVMGNSPTDRHGSQADMRTSQARGGRSQSDGQVSTTTSGSRLPACPNVVDYVDPTYGAPVRALLSPTENIHNLYYLRNPWNADQTRLLSIRSDLQQRNWRVALYDGNGCYLKDLYPVDKYDWRGVWDKLDPRYWYTFGTGAASSIVRMDVNAGIFTTMVTVPSGLTIRPEGLSINQDGTRIFTFLSDGSFHTWAVGPTFSDHRAFTPAYPSGCRYDSDGKQRYIGYKNLIFTWCTIPGGSSFVYFYEDNGTLYARVDATQSGIGHDDVTPSGKWLRPQIGTGARGVPPNLPTRVYVSDLDGSNQKVLFESPFNDYLQNFHVSCPRADASRCFLSFFGTAGKVPQNYPPSNPSTYDEIVQINVATGDTKYLVRHGSSYPPFWAEPLGVPSADGTRVLINSNRSGAIGLYIILP